MLAGAGAGIALAPAVLHHAFPPAAAMGQPGSVPRPRAVCSLADFDGFDPTGTHDCTAILNRALGEVVAAGGQSGAGCGPDLFIPPGSIAIGTGDNPDVVAPPAAASFRVRGAGSGLSSIDYYGAGTALTLSSRVANGCSIEVSGLALRPANPARAAAAGIAITYPGGLGLHDKQCVLDDIVLGIPDGNPGMDTACFDKGVIGRGLHNPSFSRIISSGPLLGAGTSRGDLFDFGDCYDIQIDRCRHSYGRAMIFQSDYCEGFQLQLFEAIGCDWVFTQDPAAAIMAGRPGAWPHRRGVFAALGLWMLNGEVNTHLGIIDANLVSGGWIGALDHTRSGGRSDGRGMPIPSSLIRLRDCPGFQANAIGMLGWLGAGDTAIDTAEAQFDNSGQTYTNMRFGQIGTIARVGGNGIALSGWAADGLDNGRTPLFVGDGLASSVIDRGVGVPFSAVAKEYSLTAAPLRISAETSILTGVPGGATGDGAGVARVGAVQPVDLIPGGARMRILNAGSVAVAILAPSRGVFGAGRHAVGLPAGQGIEIANIGADPQGGPGAPDRYVVTSLALR